MSTSTRLSKMISVGLLSSMLLSSCASSQIKQPMTDLTDVSKAFNKDGLSLISSVDGTDESSMFAGYWGIGTDMPDIEAITYDGDTINLSDTKGKPTVMVYSAYWCEFCQQTEQQMETFIQDHPDVTFIQVFADGSKDYSVTDSDGNTSSQDVIAQFYDDAEVDITEVSHEIIQENSDIVQFAGYSLLFDHFPSIYFYDESGKAVWYHEGSLNSKTFDEIAAMAFGDDESKKLNNCLVDGITKANDLYRSWKDVKADTSEEQQEKISELPLDSTYGEQAYYGNLWRTVDTEGKMVDINDEIVDVNSGRYTVYAFMTFSDENLDEDIEVWNKYAKVTNCDTSIAVFTPLSSNVDVKMSYDSLEVQPDTYTLDITTDLPEDMNTVRIMGMPQLIFVDEKNNECLGGYYGEWTLEALQKTEAAMIG